ncbi:putative integral membrane protein (TIGR02206 family) [Prosthecobacter fusiformis]|uniref:Putative integral membrane protein (TIGR02206 family) n=1 Tax=Prosthecobacter fusiformis TaxID=48464 RepID=A0A4V3FE16_9BACT|nr:TIGR02206 family membrane protein [Prosthecobacter fusiformis]TDU64130.1 putative integral membrane protein (TIGR02206 family) [Prosthecobacter fusiformis]
MSAPFQAFGSTHLTVLALCAVALMFLAGLRRWQPGAAQVAERVLALMLLMTWPMATVSHWRLGTLSWDTGLPLHFCDVAGIAGGIALLTRNRLAAEIVYFFGLAGTLQGLITPNLAVDFPDARFLVFFVLHGGVVVTALHVVTALKCPPRAWAVPRMVGLTLGYALVVGGVNAALNSNFAFLCRKPEQASLMDVLGPWPWYIGSLVVLCGIFYSVLYAPFFIARRVRAQGEVSEG